MYFPQIARMHNMASTYFDSLGPCLTWIFEGVAMYRLSSIFKFPPPQTLLRNEIDSQVKPRRNIFTKFASSY